MLSEAEHHYTGKRDLLVAETCVEPVETTLAQGNMIRGFSNFAL
jgi:hypothetical protein